MDINYYETKCRKCNNTNEFAFGNNLLKTGKNYIFGLLNI